MSIPLLLVNCLQALYFEAKESEINLDRIRESNNPPLDPLITKPQPKTGNFLRSLLQCAPFLKGLIRYGFYTQGPLHGGGDTMPVILFLRDIFDRLKWSGPIYTSIIVLVSGITFIAAVFGTHFSEVTTAVHHYDEDFQDIGRRPGLGGSHTN